MIKRNKGLVLFFIRVNSIGLKPCFIFMCVRIERDVNKLIKPKLGENITRFVNIVTRRKFRCSMEI